MDTGLHESEDPRSEVLKALMHGMLALSYLVEEKDDPYFAQEFIDDYTGHLAAYAEELGVKTMSGRLLDYHLDLNFGDPGEVPASEPAEDEI